MEVEGGRLSRAELSKGPPLQGTVQTDIKSPAPQPIHFYCGGPFPSEGQLLCPQAQTGLGGAWMQVLEEEGGCWLCQGDSCGPSHLPHSPTGCWPSHAPPSSQSQRLPQGGTAASWVLPTRPGNASPWLSSQPDLPSASLWS